MLQKRNGLSDRSDSVMLREIKQQLQQHGYEVDEQIGQSSFKCSLAVKAKPGDDHYTLSIMIDDENHYNNPNLMEQYYQRHAVLESFGWKCTHVLSKDWLQHPERVLQQIIKRLHEERTANGGQRTVDGGQWTVDGGQRGETQDGTLPITVEPVKPVTTTASTPYHHLTFKRLTCTEDGSNKFWEAAVDINKLIVRFGKIGTKGQTQVKTFKDYEQANKEMERLVREKVGKRYAG